MYNYIVYETFTEGRQGLFYFLPKLFLDIAWRGGRGALTLQGPFPTVQNSFVALLSFTYLT